ncbi:MAG: LacI family DNA-binding transcriptional regulator [Kordiimonadaceae bacterium]|nr:LacI family DNA-binding transcriptional regulator [Kordiimonadaceae bacterium]
MKPIEWLKESPNTASNIAQLAGVSTSTATRTFNGQISPNHRVVDVTADLSENLVTANDFHDAYKAASTATITA